VSAAAIAVAACQSQPIATAETRPSTNAERPESAVRGVWADRWRAQEEDYFGRALIDNDR
jgi:hypothetical protein